MMRLAIILIVLLLISFPDY
ncbi:type I toxin-antitoxin system Ibs family toxin [Escherichia coli]|nr:type I toxin-antitoxin system Ibs family toxin [Escherichia coli]